MWKAHIRNTIRTAVLTKNLYDLKGDFRKYRCMFFSSVRRMAHHTAFG